MLSRLKTALRALLRKRLAERELDEELRYHIEQQTEQNIRLGMNPEEARYAARKAFGGVEQAKERSRDARGVRWLEDWWRDLRYGLRMILKKPAFTLVAIGMLAIGIAANTAVFSIADGLILRPFDFPNQDRLVMIWTQMPSAGSHHKYIPIALFTDWQEQNQSFEQLVRC